MPLAWATAGAVPPPAGRTTAAAAARAASAAWPGSGAGAGGAPHGFRSWRGPCLSWPPSGGRP
eukprot:4711157-Alexandrium_andersonii.AAC.1